MYDVNKAEAERKRRKEAKQKKREHWQSLSWQEKTKEKAKELAIGFLILLGAFLLFQLFPIGRALR